MAVTDSTADRARRLAYGAALMQRLSGIALALFLPAHFLVLGLALEGAAALDGFLAWTEMPLVKLAEGVLVLLLGLHLVGGIRVLVIEFFAWRDGRADLIAWTAALSLACSGGFLLSAFSGG